MAPLFENAHFLVVDKEAGLLTIPGRFSSDPQAPDNDCAWKRWEQKIQCKLWIVHRLDQEVSGLLMFAKSAEAHRAASLWFEKREVHKEYEALTEKPQAGTVTLGQEQKWESLLLRGKKRAYEKPFGKRALTFATALSEETVGATPALRWKLNPVTGRSHQLRYETMKHGCPVLGDALYGSTTKLPKEKGIALRSTRIDFKSIPDRSKWELPEEVSAPGILDWLKQ